MSAIGFIGLGNMGQHMAANLLKSGFKLHVFDIVPEKVADLKKQGAKVESTIAEMISKVDFIVLSVQTSQQVRDICSNPEGIFSLAKPNLLLIDCSSIDMAVSQSLHKEAASLRIGMLDAPVSGGVAAAKAATLTFMVGGEAQDFEKGLPILKAMGKKIVHAGPAGMGQAAKICNNLLLGISMIGVCEAFTLAKKMGLNQKKFFEISSNASGQCWSMTSYCPVPHIVDNVPSNQEYKPGFMAKMMLKDLRLSQHAAEAVDAVLPLGSTAAELFELFVGQGHGEMDFSGIIHLIEMNKVKKN